MTDAPEGSPGRLCRERVQTLSTAGDHIAVTIHGLIRAGGDDRIREAEELQELHALTSGSDVRIAVDARPPRHPGLRDEARLRAMVPLRRVHQEGVAQVHVASLSGCELDGELGDRTREREVA